MGEGDLTRLSRFQQITDEEFTEVIENSEYMVDVLEKLGYQRTSGTMTKYVKERVERLGLDLSHFIGQKGTRGGGKSARYTLEEILVEDSFYTNRPTLKRRLIKSGLLVYECAICKLKGTWQGKPLVLHLDHINGVHNDHRLENLRLLCPNCHTQTETYSGRNIGTYDK